MGPVDGGSGKKRRGFSLTAERNRLRTELDGMIANIYGLTQEEFEYILSTFPLVPQAQKETAIECFLTFKEQFDRDTEESQHWKALIAQGWVEPPPISIILF